MAILPPVPFQVPATEVPTGKLRELVEQVVTVQRVAREHANHGLSVGSIPPGCKGFPTWNFDRQPEYAVKVSASAA